MKLKAQSHPSNRPSSKENNLPTFEQYTANPSNGEIRDINVAFTEFQKRMTLIGNQYTGAKKAEFFKQLNECSIDRFKVLAMEYGQITFNSAREAEFMLQYEFEGHCEPNSVRRTTQIEKTIGNGLDGRFTIIENDYTDFDVKGPVSQETLIHQGQPMDMYEQGHNMGEKIISQKKKHCNPHLAELPSSPKNVKHIVSLIELSVDETGDFVKGLSNGLKEELAQENQISKELLSDKMAFDGVSIMNNEFTIKRVN